MPHPKSLKALQMVKEEFEKSCQPSMFRNFGLLFGAYIYIYISWKFINSKGS